MIALLFAMVLVSQPQPVAATNVPNSPAVSVSLTNGSVSVAIDIRVSQNLTGLDRLFSLPQFNGLLVGQNASTVSAMVQDSLGRENSSGIVSNLSLGLSSSQPTNGTVLQWFNVSLRFQVRGVQTPQNGFENTDLSWKSFVLPSNVTVGPVEVNYIGRAYMHDAAAFIANLEAPASGTFAYKNLVNDRIATYVGLTAAMPKIQLLNFTRFLPSVDTWKEGYDFDSRSVTWSMDGGPGLGFVVQQTNQEPRNMQTISNGLFYSFIATIFAPAKSIARGNLIITSFQDTSETLMGTAIIAAIALGSSSYIYESRILNRRGRKQKRPPPNTRDKSSQA